MRSIGVVVFASLLAGTALAEEADPHAACAGAVGWVPSEILNRPVKLHSDLGTVTEKVTTKSKEALALYRQGLAYLHGYVWIEAIRSFNQALRSDPDLAMAYLGLSRAYSGIEDTQAAKDAYAKAQALGAKASEWERTRIALRGVQLSAMDARADVLKHVEYKTALDAALAQYPGDAELWLLRGNAEEATAAGRGQRGRASSIAFYEAALARHPNHPAAHHYLVHTYETIGQIDLALKHGKIFAQLSSGIPHAHHMYGHDLRRVGRVDEAIQRFERTMQLELAYYARENIPSKLDWHHLHNLALLATSYQQVGRMKDAERLLQQLARDEAVMENVDLARRDYALFLLLRGRFDDAHAAALELTKSSFAATRAVAYATAGMVKANSGDWAQAKKYLETAKTEAKGKIGIGELPVQMGVVQGPIDILTAQIQHHDGKRAEAVALLEDVQKRLRAALGPDAWITALYQLESIAQFARRAEDVELAEKSAKQMFDHDPNYGGAHYALAQVASKRGDTAAYKKALGEVRRRWRNGDADLPELAEARTLARR